MVSIAGILKLWWPLLGTWLLMAMESPFLGSLISRMPAAEENLAAYGLGFAVALLVEAPIINMLPAAVRVCHDVASYRLLQQFNHLLCVLCSGVMIVLALPFSRDWLFEGVMGIPEDIAELTRQTILVLLPWPAAIGYRRFYQGMMINFHQPRRITVGTFVRLTVVMLAGYLLMSQSALPGTVVAGISMSLGVVMECAAAMLAVRPELRRFLAAKDLPPFSEHWDKKRLWEFYCPLMITTMTSLTIAPMTTFAAARSSMTVPSLAVLPVLNAFIFVFRAVALSYQEVVIAAMRSWNRCQEVFHHLRRISRITTGLSVLVLIGFISARSLYDALFLGVMGINSDLAEFMLLPFCIMALLAPLSIWLNWRRSLLIFSKVTRPISQAALIELGIVVTLLVLGNFFLATSGAVVVAISLSVARGVATIFVTFCSNHLMHRYAKVSPPRFCMTGQNQGFG